MEQEVKEYIRRPRREVALRRVGRFEYASLRFFAFITDVLLLGYVVWAVNYLLPRLAMFKGAEFRFPVLPTLIVVIELAALWGSLTITVGGRIIGLELLRSDGTKPGLARGLLRFLGWNVSLGFAGLGLLWMLWDARRQGWHDRLADTQVIAKERVRRVEGKPRPWYASIWGMLVVLALAISYVTGWKVTRVDMNQLLHDAYLMKPLILNLIQPDVLSRDKESLKASLPFGIPCASFSPSHPSPPATGPYIQLSRTCGEMGEPLTIEGHRFSPHTKVKIWLIDAISSVDRITEVTADDSGSFSVDTTVPQEVRGTQFTIEAEFSREVGRPYPSKALNLTIEKMIETIFLALMATTLAIIFTVPLSFLAARNLMVRLSGSVFAAIAAAALGVHGVGLGFYLGTIAGPLAQLPTVELFSLDLSGLTVGLMALLGVGGVFAGGRLSGQAIYYLTRTYFNILRSIEPLIMAVLFIVWVGIGPFAGMLALALHSVAALGKLYSEAIESIDPGPIEAITATGANSLQVIVYGVIPQIIPQYVAFTIYRWDINVRMSTVIGFVGGGGIGYLLIQYINLMQWRQAATAVWAINLVVWLMDYLSAVVRERIV